MPEAIPGELGGLFWKRLAGIAATPANDRINQ